MERERETVREGEGKGERGGGRETVKHVLHMQCFMQS